MFEDICALAADIATDVLDSLCSPPEYARVTPSPSPYRRRRRRVEDDTCDDPTPGPTPDEVAINTAVAYLVLTR